MCGGGGILIRGGLYVIGHLNGLHIPSLKCYEEEGGGGVLIRGGIILITGEVYHP